MRLSGRGRVMGVKTMAAGLAALMMAGGAAQAEPGALRTYLHQHYPSLAYVEHYRAAYPADQTAAPPPWLATAADPGTDPVAVIQALTALADQHVGIGGPKAGKTETLGALFRTSTDGRMVVWRVFGDNAKGLKVGDEVVAIAGQPAAIWLKTAADRAFAGNPRSRRAEAVVNLALGSPLHHRLLGAEGGVDLQVASPGEAPRAVRVAYVPMTGERASALNAAVNQPDLPREMMVAGRRVGTVRIGAFAPQYDPAFNTAADAAAKAAGSDEGDGPMLAGFCAVTRAFAKDYDAIAAHSDLMVLDLRGNLGGFGREARLLAWAISGKAPAATYDLFATGQAGKVKLVRQPEDPSCGTVKNLRPILVLTDAGTRSSGEFMASWLWASGAVVAGERTAGAGGGFEFGTDGVDIDGSGLNVRVSGNFSVLDPTGQLSAGETAEGPLVDQLAQDRFAPSRTRPFSFQAVGVVPDLAAPTGLADLRDGGQAMVARLLRGMK